MWSTSAEPGRGGAANARPVALAAGALASLCASGCYGFLQGLGQGLSELFFAASLSVAGLVALFGVLQQWRARRRQVGAVGLAVAWALALGVIAASFEATQRFDPRPGTLGRALWPVWLALPAVANAPLLTARYVVQRSARSLWIAWLVGATLVMLYVSVLARASMVAAPSAFEGRMVELAVTDAWAYARTDDGRLYTLEPTYAIPGTYRALRGDAAAAIAIDDVGRAFVLRGTDAPQALSLPGSAVAVAAGPTFQCLVVHTGALACLQQRDPEPTGNSGREWHERWPKVDSSFDAVEQVAVSEELVCALERGGRVRCRPGGFGGPSNELFRASWKQRLREGRSGPFEPHDVPTLVLVERGARAVAVTRSAVCVLGDDARVRCAGEGHQGELGPGAQEPSRRPSGRAVELQEIPNLVDVEQLEAGSFHLCARTGGGEVHCWGGNGWGQLGVAGFDGRPTPAKVALPGPARELIRHSRSTCARLADDSLWCWGAQRAPGALLRGEVCHASVFGAPSVCANEPVLVATPKTYVPAP